MIFNLVALAFLLATLPLLLELAILTLASYLPASRKLRSASRTGLGRLTVLIPAHNEEELIGRAVRSALAAGSQVDVLVIAHNCSDRTAGIAAAAGARLLPIDDPQRTGKGCALESGFASALEDGADAVLVMDADSIASDGLVDVVRNAFSAGADVVQTRYEVENGEHSNRTRLMVLALLAFNGVRPRGRARLGLSAGILGNGFAVRADVLRRIPYSAFSVVEDLEYHLNLVRAGYKVEFLDQAVMLGQMPLSDHGARTQRARWEGGRKRMRRQWSLRLAGEVLRGRFRLLEPLLDLLAQPLGLEVLLLAAAALLPVAWVRGYALCGLVILAAHLLTAARGPDFWGTLRALLFAPGYLLWKLRLLPAIWRASQVRAAWIRTDRGTGSK